MASDLDKGPLTQIRNIEHATGRRMDEWIALVRQNGPARHSDIIAWLKSEHGFTYGNANLALKAREAEQPAPRGGDDLVEAQYSGPKAGLRPIYDSLLDAVIRYGGDVEVSPKKAYVSLRRQKQFAIVQPSSAARLDVGINLKGVEPVGRLEASGSFNSMVSHRVGLGSAAEVGEELIGWLRAAYEAA